MTAALIEAARAALDSWARDECVQFVSRSDGHRTTTTVSRDALLLLVTRALAAAEQPAEPVPTGWDGTEEWEALAWHLCAEENGEDACNELVWEGGPMPEPWGDRWLKYEGPAKDMIAKVRKFASPTAPAQAPLPHLKAAADAVMAHQWSNSREAMQALTELIEAALAHGIGSKA